jgi:hypothetical protein
MKRGVVICTRRVHHARRKASHSDSRPSRMLDVGAVRTNVRIISDISAVLLYKL